ncbi:MAG: peptidyl-alpha-hydroxyglycine alpha-amidating lyase family protein [Congregibacter sp.]
MNSLQTLVLSSQLVLSAATFAQNYAPNPYESGLNWGVLPGDRSFGSTSAIYPARDGKHIWVAERCGANSCVGSEVDPVLLFDLEGNLVRSFGAGLFAWPHGMYVDTEDNVWVADSVGYRPVPEGIGHVIYKFSPQGELLLTLGRIGEAGDGEYTFRKPSDVLVAPNGSIFVVDGHGSSAGQPVNNRVVKFNAQGQYILSWGMEGGDAGEFSDPHALAMDKQGRLFVGDRANSRIQLFDQEGRYLETWTQFGRPSGIYIDANDVIYVADSESNARRNPGWKRGIRIGRAKDGFVTAFIPDPETDQDNSGTSGAEGIAVDAVGNIYAAEVGPRAVKKYLRR